MPLLILTQKDMKALSLLTLLVLSMTSLSAQERENFDPGEKFPADSIKSWTHDILSEASSAHPGMYRYTEKSEFDSLIKSMLLTVNDSLTTIEFYRKLKPLFAQIGCLHTSVTLSKEAKEYYQKVLKFIPIEVFINDDRQVFVTKNHDEENKITLGSEILSINNQPTSEIMDVLYHAVPSDGYNQTLKALMLNHRFAFWYQSMISTTDSFSIEVRTANQTRTYNLPGVTEEVFPSFESVEHANEKQLRFELEGDIGLLTVHSFAKSVIKKNGQNFDKFIQQAFKTLNEKEVKNLVIDLRNNTGGTDGNAAFLTSYFFDKPFKYWQHPVEMTEDMAEQFKIWYRIFYKMPKKVDSTYYWKGANGWLTKEFNYYKVQKPAKHNYKGTVYLITNGACMSSCADVVAILSHNNKAKVVGQETGGGYQGNTSGMMPTTKIPANLEMTIPLQKYTNAVDPKKNIGRGTIPDFMTTPSLQSRMKKRDVEMELVNELILGLTSKKTL